MALGWRLAQVLLAVAALMLARPAIALDPRQPLAELVHNGWALPEGAPSSVGALAQTPQGDLWLGTGSGLYRFDGLRFEQFRTDGKTSLLSEMISELAITSSGDIWVGYHERGVSRIHDGRIQTFVTEIPGGPVKQIVQAKDGSIWVATFGGVAVFKDGVWKALPWSEQFGRAFSMVVGRDGVLWIATDHALLLVNPGSLVAYRTAEPVQGTWALAQAPDGRIWLSDEKWGLRPLDPLQLRQAKPSPVEAQPRPALLRARRILFDRDGSLWGSYQDGMGVFRILHPGRRASGESLHQTDVDESYGAKSGLTSDVVAAMLEDREGDIWVGTDMGLDRFRSADVNVAHSIPVGSREGYRAVVGSTGELYVADADTLYHGKSDAEFKVIGRDYGHPDEFCAGKNGTIWFLDKKNLTQIQGEKLTRVELPALARPGELYTCGEDNSGTLWVSVLDIGLFTYAHSQWRGPIPNPVPGNVFPRLLVADRGGGMWAYDRGVDLFLIEKGRTQRFSGSQGLKIGEIRTIISNRDGTLVGGELGIARFRNGRFESLTTDRFPGLSVITGIAQNARGDTWLSSVHGITKLRTSDVLAAFADPRAPLPMRRFDFRDGLPGVAQQTCCHRTAFEDRWGRIWFTTSRGVAWVDPGRLTFNRLPPPVLVRSVTVNGRSLPLSTKMRFPPAVADARFDFAAPSLPIPERVRFLYRLEGVDKQWVDPGERRQAFYTKLPPGTYRFQVIAANNDGVWNKTGATIAFAIPPTFVQTRLFLALCIAAGIGLLTIAYLWRSRQISDQLRRRLEERLRERERIARDLHDTLLQGVQGMVLRFGAIAERAPRGSTFRCEMDEALARGEAVIGESRDHIFELRTTGSAKALVERFEAIGAEFRGRSASRLFVATEGDVRDLTAPVLEEVSKVGCEAIRNAFQHAGASTIAVEIIYGAEALRLVVRDDGAGLAPEVLQRGRAGHFGLPGMRERARRIGARLSLVNLDGAWMELSVPARMAYEGRATVWERRRLVRVERAQA